MRDGINAYDAVQVRVDFDNGMSINFHNNWITPPDFEGPVNQGHEIVGADGKVESDQQYRGFRWWNKGGGSRTSNNHFTREVLRADGTRAYVGYGVDSLTVGLVAVCRVKFAAETRDAVAHLYPTAEEARITCAIVEFCQPCCFTSSVQAIRKTRGTLSLPRPWRRPQRYGRPGCG